MPFDRVVGLKYSHYISMSSGKALLILSWLSGSAHTREYAPHLSESGKYINYLVRYKQEQWHPFMPVA